MVDVMGVSKRNQNIHVEQIHRRSDTQVVDHLINHLTGYNGGSRFPKDGQAVLVDSETSFFARRADGALDLSPGRARP